MFEEPRKFSRRDFLATGTCGAMGVGSLVNTIAQLQLINSAAASSLPIGSDYKALVCIFLRGGCDMNNVVIPRTTHPQAAAYANDRGVVGINNGVVHELYNITGLDDTIPITVPATDPFGLHPSCANLASMFNTGEAAFVTNVGTLAHPTTPANYNSISLPTQLFSHSNQVTEWMSSISDKPYTSGWGARVAELYHDTWNPLSSTSMLITAAGNNQFMNGGEVFPYSVTSAGAISLTGFGTNYSSALNPDGTYKDGSTGDRLKALERIMTYSHSHLLEDGYSTVVQRARENEAIITEATQAASGVDIEATWTAPSTNVGNELKAIAKLIAGRHCLGNTRQIFFVDLGGFDNHQDINDDLGRILGEVDDAVGAFNNIMKALDAVPETDFDYNMVTTFQASDFNRTWTPNSEDPGLAGTDHAWGTHSFVVGGAVNGGIVDGGLGNGGTLNGGTLYGSFPELAVGGLNDVPSGSRGRWIPTTSVDQFAAVLAEWFGVPPGSSEMAAIFPNLTRFEDPFGGSANLGFL
jgi:uncharacterized protein (DUF1501 family)